MAHDVEPVQAWVEDPPRALLPTGMQRRVFVRFVPRGILAAARHADTVDATACYVDLDADGVVIGLDVYLPETRDDPAGAGPPSQVASPAAFDDGPLEETTTHGASAPRPRD